MITIPKMDKQYKSLSRTEAIANTLVQHGAKITEHNDEFIEMKLNNSLYKIYYGIQCVINNEKIIYNKEELDI
jgi:hypothetical protein